MFIHLENAEWFNTLPGSVHECFYNSAVEDQETLAAFANCQKTDGGEKCIRNIPAGLNCLNIGLPDHKHLYKHSNVFPKQKRDGVNSEKRGDDALLSRGSDVVTKSGAGIHIVVSNRTKRIFELQDLGLNLPLASDDLPRASGVVNNPPGFQTINVSNCTKRIHVL